MRAPAPVTRTLTGLLAGLFALLIPGVALADTHLGPSKKEIVLWITVAGVVTIAAY